MTDYLYQAMEQDREDREEAGVDLLAGAFRELPGKQEGPGETGGVKAWRPEEEAAEGPVSGTGAKELRSARNGAVDRALEPGEAVPGTSLTEEPEEGLQVREAGSVLRPGTEGAYTSRGGAVEGPQAVYRSLVQSEQAAGTVRGPGRRLTVSLPEAPASAGLDPQALDRAVERDARRYDGGFWLY